MSIRCGGRLARALFKSPRSRVDGCKWFSSSYNEDREREILNQFKGGSVDLHMDKTAGLASIILNNPEKKNALSGSMMVDLHDVVTELEKWKEGKGVCMYGAGNVFCSGGDLDLMKNIAGGQEAYNMSYFVQSALLRLQRIHMLSISLVEGRALGGGAELLTTTDFRVVSERVSIGFVQGRMGISTGWGGGTRLVELVGPRVALDLLGSCRILSWKEAMDLGLVDSVLRNQSDFIDSAKMWLLKRIQGSAPVVRACKKTVLAYEDRENTAEALERERKVFASVWGSPAHLEALNEKIKHK